MADERFDEELSEEEYKDDINRIVGKLHLENVQSHEEFIMRLDDYGLMTEHSQVKKFVNLIWNSKVKNYVQENTKEKEPLKVGKPRRKLWTPEEVNYLKSNLKLPASQLWKSPVLQARTLKSVSVKKSRLKKSTQS